MADETAKPTIRFLSNAPRAAKLRNPPAPGRIGQSPNTIRYSPEKEEKKAAVQKQARADAAIAAVDAKNNPPSMLDNMLGGASSMVSGAYNSLFGEPTPEEPVVSGAAPMHQQLSAQLLTGLLGPSAASYLIGGSGDAAGVVTDGADFVTDAALVTGDTAVMGQTPVAAGVINALGAGALTGGETGLGGTKGGFIDRYNAGFNQQRDAVLAARDDLGILPTLAADVAGGVGGVGGKLTKAVVEDVIPAAFNTGVAKRIGRAFLHGTDGAVQTLAQTYNYMDEDSGTAELMGNAALGFMFGAGAQGAIGDYIIPWLKTSAASRFVARSLLNQGVGKDAGRPAQVADALRAMAGTNKGLHDTGVKNFGRDDVLDRGAKALDEMTLPFLGGAEGNMERATIARFTGGKEAISRAVHEMNADATQRFANVVGNPHEPNEVAAALAPGLKPFANILGGMSRDMPSAEYPNPLGMTRYDAKAGAKRMANKFSAVIGNGIRMINTPSGVKQTFSADKGAQTAFNTLIANLRTKEILPGANKLSAVVADGALNAAADGVLLKDGSLASLYQARQRLAAMVDPGPLASGIERHDAASVFKLLDIVDEEIADTAGPAAGLARGAFARMYTIQDFDAIGERTYQALGKLTDPENRRVYMRDTEAVMKRIKGDPEFLTAYQNGAMRALKRDVGENGFMNAVVNKLGDVVDFDNPSFLKGKTGTLTKLTDLLGEQNLREIVDLYNTSMQNQTAVDRISAALEPSNLARVRSKVSVGNANASVDASASSNFMERGFSQIDRMLGGVLKNGGNVKKLLLMMEAMGNDPKAAQQVGGAAAYLADQTIKPVGGYVGAALTAPATDKGKGVDTGQKSIMDVLQILGGAGLAATEFLPTAGAFKKVKAAGKIIGAANELRK